MLSLGHAERGGKTDRLFRVVRFLCKARSSARTAFSRPATASLSASRRSCDNLISARSTCSFLTAAANLLASSCCWRCCCTMNWRSVRISALCRQLYIVRRNQISVTRKRQREQRNAHYRMLLHQLQKYPIASAKCRWSSVGLPL
jgi:hypothetical protein